MSRFKSGQSGNPSGRPKGIPNPQAQLRQAIGQRSDEIIQVLVDKALEGDVAAASLLLSRILPTARPESLATPIENAGETMVGRADRIVSDAISGRLSTTVASELMGVLANQAKIIETQELEQRIVALEARTK